MDAKEGLKIKLNHVVFAEAVKDFVDVLFSFLTLPMVTIVWLLQKQSLLLEFGSMNTLYEGLEKLDVGYFITSKHKDVLLRLNNSAEAECRKLKVNIDDTNPTKYYCCENLLRGSICPKCCLLTTSLGECTIYGRSKRIEAYLMEDNATRDEDDKGGVFVMGSAKFTISDDLNVMPMSGCSSFELFFKLGVKDLEVLEERIVECGPEEVLSLLRLSLLSQTPLTEWSKSPKSQADFVNYPLSLLTIPLGSVLNLLEKSSSLGCISNIYTSVKAYSYMKNEYNKTKLISPKISASFHPKNPCKFQSLTAGRKHVKTFKLLDSSTLVENPIGINGFVKVTDNLIVMPSSLHVNLSLTKSRFPWMTWKNRSLASAEMRLLVYSRLHWHAKQL